MIGRLLVWLPGFLNKDRCNFQLAIVIVIINLLKTVSVFLYPVIIFVLVFCSGHVMAGNYLVSFIVIPEDGVEISFPINIIGIYPFRIISATCYLIKFFLIIFFSNSMPAYFCPTRRIPAGFTCRRPYNTSAAI